jgi:SET domain
MGGTCLGVTSHTESPTTVSYIQRSETIMPLLIVRGWWLQRLLRLLLLGVAMLGVRTSALLTTTAWTLDLHRTTTTSCNGRRSRSRVLLRLVPDDESAGARRTSSLSGGGLRRRQTATLQRAIGTVQHLMDMSSSSAAAAPQDNNINHNLNKKRPRGYNVEQRPSNIPGAGMGLFATQSIQAGTIVAYYPVHRMGVEYDDNDNHDHEHDGEFGTDRNDAEATSFSVTVNSIDEEYFSSTADMSGTTTTADRIRQQSSNYLHFLMGKRPLAPAAVDNNNDSYNGGGATPDTDYFQGGLLYIDVNPQRRLVPGWMSHLVNDGATVLVNTEQGVLDYYSASRAAKNCVHVPFGPSPILATVTTRKVKKGQELLTTYGCTYWLDALLKSHNQQQQQSQQTPSITTDITDAIQEQATETARDILKCRQGVVVRRQNEAFELHEIFKVHEIFKATPPT